MFGAEKRNCPVFRRRQKRAPLTYPMRHTALSSPAARAQQSAHTTLDTTNECPLPCPLDMPFAPLLRFSWTLRSA